MPKIQLALDVLSAERALEIAQAASPWVDILEAGTPLIKSAGIGIVSRLKVAHPTKLVLADLKSTDVGAYEAAMGFRAGADIVTTLGVTTLATIEEVQREANRWGRRCQVDLTGVADPVGKAHELKAIGVSFVLYHRSIDEEVTKGATWSESVCRLVHELCGLGIDVAVAGGIGLDTLPRLQSCPLYAIVGLNTCPVSERK
mgnify:CR=1 FL=1